MSVHDNPIYDDMGKSSDEDRNDLRRSDDVFEEEVPENNEEADEEPAVRGALLYIVPLHRVAHHCLTLLATFRVPTCLPLFKH